jgi:MFS family permease
LISDIYPPAIRARMQGYLSSIWASAAICGPLLGAFCVATLSWRWIFWVNVPLGIAAILLLSIVLHESAERRSHRIDYLGSILMMLGIGTLIFTFIQATSLGLVACLALGTIALAILALLIVQERRAAEPILPLRLWRSRVVLTSNLACLTVGAITMSSSAFLPAYVQGVMGRSPLIAGYVVSVSSVTWMFGSAAGGRIMLHYSYRLAATIGSCIVICGSLVLITLDPARGPLWAATGTALTGLGMGLFQNTFFLAAQASVERLDRGSATGSVLFSRILGQTVGTALFGGIVNVSLASRIGGNAVSQIMDPALRDKFPAAEIAPLMTSIADALRHVYWAAFLFALIGLVATLGLPRGLSPTKAATK